jgi:hypothetical protein
MWQDVPIKAGRSSPAAFRTRKYRIRLSGAFSSNDTSKVWFSSDAKVVAALAFAGVLMSQDNPA